MPHPPRETLSASDRSDLRVAHELVLHRPLGNGGASLWRNIALVVLGICVSLGATYVRDAISRHDLISRAELRQEMADASPYAIEREMLRDWRSHVDTRLTTLEARLDKLAEQIQALQVMVAQHHSVPGRSR